MRGWFSWKYYKTQPSTKPMRVHVRGRQIRKAVKEYLSVLCCTHQKILLALVWKYILLKSANWAKAIIILWIFRFYVFCHKVYSTWRCSLDHFVDRYLLSIIIRANSAKTSVIAIIVVVSKIVWQCMQCIRRPLKISEKKNQKNVKKSKT